MTDANPQAVFLSPEAYQNPTLYVNIFHILMSATTTKIVFGEETIPGNTTWRLSIATPPPVAKELAIVLANLCGVTADDLKTGGAVGKTS
jgi:hypothetical protein